MILSFTSTLICLKLILTTVTALIYLLHLVLVLLQGCLVVVEYYIFLWTAVLVV